jgi:hypothetical protein
MVFVFKTVGFLETDVPIQGFCSTASRATDIDEGFDVPPERIIVPGNSTIATEPAAQAMCPLLRLPKNNTGIENPSAKPNLVYDRGPQGLFRVRKAFRIVARIKVRTKVPR